MSATTDFKFDSEPTMDTWSGLLGEIQLYAPDADPSEWSKLPWKLTTRHGWDGHESAGLHYILKPECAIEAYKHIALVDDRHLWDNATS